MNLSQNIIEIFETYLEAKGVQINNPEREQSGEGACQIYGSEYGDLQEKIEEAINDEPCVIVTDYKRFEGKLQIMDDQILVQSESLQEYLEEYSME